MKLQFNVMLDEDTKEKIRYVLRNIILIKLKEYE